MVTVELSPTAMVAGGSAIARDENGRVVFVDGALPGEVVIAAIRDDNGSHATADVVTVVEPSPARVAPPCPEVARGCGACGWQHIALDAQLRYKEDVLRDALTRLGRIEVPEFLPARQLAPWAFRTTVRAAVVDGHAGFRAARSHDVCAVGQCLVAHPLLEPLLVDGRYAGATEVLLRCGARTGERMAAVTPVRAERTVPDDVRDRDVHEIAAGHTWRISASSFFQTRADCVDVLAELVGDAAGELGDEGTALDLYAGVGVFAGVLASRGWHVTAVEGARRAASDARANLRGMSVDVVCADVLAYSPPPASFVVADPSRNGLGRRGVATVVASGASRVVLVSCDAASLGRDAGLLRDAGYRSLSLTAVDLFPHTPHIEAVSVFDRT